MKKETYNRWRLINYTDVWGNADEGYEVNNLCTEFDDLYLAENITNEELIEYLKEIEFFSSEASTYTINVLDYGDTIEFESSENAYAPGYPLCRLERVYE